MKNIDTLFICKANVGRSQIAEGFYNYYSKTKSISCAGVEARKDKYNGKPDENIIQLMQNRGIDISKQNINYIRDFELEVLDKVEKIIFLYYPGKDNKVDNECRINGLSPYNFLLQNYKEKIMIKPINDPFGEKEKAIVKIIGEIEKIVKTLI